MRHLAFLVGLVLVLAVACAGEGPSGSPTPTGLGGTGVPLEDGLLIPPDLVLEVDEAAPGDKVRLTGAGGYVRRPDGSYDESSRDFLVFFDGVEAGSVTCYVNRCEGSFTVPSDAMAGPHEVWAEHGNVVTITVVR